MEEMIEANVGQDAAAQETSRPTWEALMQDPEYNRKMQEVVKSRLRAERSSEERLKVLSPALEALSRRYGVADGDDAALAAAIAAEPVESPQQKAEAAIAAHFRGMEEQAAHLRQTVPGFDLRQALRDPAFARLTAPGGVGVEDAFFALHRGEMQTAAMEAAARGAAEMLSRAIQAGARRPSENGAGAAAAPVFDYRKASREEREALKERIRRGEKVYP